MENNKDLQAQLNEYKLEKERVRKIIGEIGSRRGSKLHKMINHVFLLAVLVVFIIGTIFETISYMLVLNLGVLFACIKLIWMLNEQQKVNHFQFWILSTLEIKINSIERELKNQQKNSRKEQ